MLRHFVSWPLVHSESPNQKAPLILIDPKSEGSKAYTQIVEKIIND